MWVTAKDGDSGLKENFELACVLREELPDAHMMFDNHSIWYYADVDYSVRLCKAVAGYKPFLHRGADLPGALGWVCQDQRKIRRDHRGWGALVRGGFECIVCS